MESEKPNVYYNAKGTFESQVTLLPHQKTAIKYIVSTCRKQHGLLLNHYQGTGKTITGVSFLKNYKDTKKVIIVPEALQNMWKTMCIGINNVTYITYEDLESIQYKDYTTFEEKIKQFLQQTKDSIVVSDESHNLLKILNSCQMSGSDEILDMLNFQDLSEGKKRTWIENNEEIRNYRKKLQSYLNLFLECKKVIFLTGTPITRDIEDIRWFINLCKGHEISEAPIVPYISDKFKEQFMTTSPLENKYVKMYGPIISFLNPNNHLPEYMKVGGVEDYRSIIMNLLDAQISGTNIISKAIKQAICNTVIYYMKMFQKQLSKINLNDKFIKTCGKYISFYKYEDPNKEHYPDVTYVSHPLEYTDYQYDVWTRGCNDKLTYDEMKCLRFSESMEDAILFHTIPDIIGYNGRIIGNMIEVGQTVIYPNKFVEIVNMYKNEKTLVYSNYYESGILLFEKYLQHKEIVNYKIYHPELSPEDQLKIISDFETGTINMLLLHPAFFEGFSIKNVRVFHILEPINSVYKQEQLYTRAARYDSHKSLIKEDRIVTIHQWYCSFKTFNATFKTKKIKLFEGDFGFLEQLVLESPDDVIISKFEENKSSLDISNILKQSKLTCDDETHPECCIDGDTCTDDVPMCINIDVKGGRRQKKSKKKEKLRNPREVFW